MAPATRFHLTRSSVSCLQPASQLADRSGAQHSVGEMPRRSGPSRAVRGGERGVERALVKLEDVWGNLLNALRDASPCIEHVAWRLRREKGGDLYRGFCRIFFWFGRLQEHSAGSCEPGQWGWRSALLFKPTISATHCQPHNLCTLENRQATQMVIRSAANTSLGLGKTGCPGVACPLLAGGVVLQP